MNSKARTLLRTNPLLSSNVKITIDGDLAHFNSIDADKNLTQQKFKDQKVNFTGSYESDLYAFWELGKTSSEFTFKDGRTSPDEKFVRQFGKQYERLYVCGVERNTSTAVTKQFKIFAPLWAQGEIPKKFIIFRTNNPSEIKYGENPSALVVGVTYKVMSGVIRHNNINYAESETFTAKETSYSGDGSFVLHDKEYEQSLYDTKSIISKSEIIEVYDLSYKTAIGNYLTRAASNFPNPPINVDFQNMEITYNGIDISSGNYTSKVESILPNIHNLVGVSDFDYWVTSGFKRQNMACGNIFNLEFCFDDTENVGNMSRYFGVYCDEVMLEDLQVDYEDLFSRYNSLKPLRTTVPLVYDKQIEDANGIEVSLLNPAQFNLFDDNCFTFLSVGDDFQLIKKLQDDKAVLSTTKMMSSEIFSFGNRQNFTCEKLSDCLDNSYIVVNREFEVGDIIRIRANNKTICEIIADDLPDLNLENYTPVTTINGVVTNAISYTSGGSVAKFFYPYGSPAEIAIAIQTAINRTIIDDSITATVLDDVVVVHRIEYGHVDNDCYIESSSQSVTIEHPILAGGGYGNLSRTAVGSDFPHKDGEYILTARGYSKIKSVARLYSPDFEQLRSSNRDSFLSSYVLTIIDDTDAIFVSQSSEITKYDLLPVKYGVFNVCPISDFDTSTTVSDYNRSPKAEYAKYFNVESGQLRVAENSRFVLQYVRTKGIGSGFDLSYKVTGSSPLIDIMIVQYVDGGVYFSDHDIIDDICTKINEQSGTSNCFATANHNNMTIVVEIRDGNVNSHEITLDTAIIDPAPYGNFLINLDSETSYGGHVADEYRLIPFDGQTVTISFTDSIGPNTTTVTYPTVFDFVPYSPYYEILSGDCIVVNKKFVDDLNGVSVFIDNELNEFIGFNSLSAAQEALTNNSAVSKSLSLMADSLTEYDFLRENELEINLLYNKTVPLISKWVLDGCKDVRGNDYRLNISIAFNEFNFSPSSRDNSKNAKYFTHEWYYLSNVPHINDGAIETSNSYFDTKFDTSRYARSLSSYFDEYFTIEDLTNPLTGNKIDIGYQERYATITKENGANVVFFKGVKYKISGDADYTDWKFSIVLNAHRTYGGVWRRPVDYELIENKDHKNIVLVVSVVVDDYKSVPYVTRRDAYEVKQKSDEVNIDYAYLYMMNGIKSVTDTGEHVDGYLIDIPQMDVAVGGGSITSPPYNDAQPSPIYGYEYFYGVKTFLAVGNVAPTYIAFVNSPFLVGDLIKGDEFGNFGTLYGINATNSDFMSTSPNTVGTPSGSYVTYKAPRSIDGNSPAVYTGSYIDYFDNDRMYLGDGGINGLYVIESNGVVAMSESSIVSATSIVDLNGMVWWQDGGGRDSYSELSKYLSFAGFCELIEKGSSLIRKSSIRNRTMISSNIRIDVIQPNTVDIEYSASVIEKNVSVPQYPNIPISVYSLSNYTLNVPQKIYRYGGNYSPKFTDVVKFTNKKIDMPWMVAEWNWEVMHRWDDLIYAKSKMSAITDCDQFSLDLKTSPLVNEYGHKKTLTDFPKLTFPVDNKRIEREMPVVQVNKNVFQPHIDGWQYALDAKPLSSSWASATDMKSYLSSVVFVPEDSFSYTLKNSDVEVEAIDGTRSVKFDINNIFYEYYKDAIMSCIDGYTSVDKESFIREYIMNNLVGCYKSPLVTVFARQSTEFKVDETETSILLLSRGFSKTINFKVKNDGNILSVDTAGNQEINIKLNFDYKKGAYIVNNLSNSVLNIQTS